MIVSCRKYSPKADRDQNHSLEVQQSVTQQQYLYLGFALSTDLTFCMTSHTPQYLGIEGCGLLVNLRDRDNLPTKDKIPVPKVPL